MISSSCFKVACNLRSTGNEHKIFCEYISYLLIVLILYVANRLTLPVSRHKSYLKSESGRVICMQTTS